MKLNNILSSSYFIGAVITIVILLFLPEMFSKYSTEVVEKKVLQGEKYAYSDLDNDGNSEIISFLINDYNPTISIKDINGVGIDEFPARAKFDERFEYFFGDADNDNFLELYYFTYDFDSLFINVIEPLDKKTNINIRRRYLRKLEFFNHLPDVLIYNVGMEDANKDGIEEYYFAIMAGMCKHPRKIFSYNPVLDTVFSSPDLGSGFWPNYEFFDIDNDGKPEILSDHNSVGNYKDTIGKYHDSDCWYSPLDLDLNLIHKPIRFKYYMSSIYTSPAVINDSNYVLVLYICNLKDYEQATLNLIDYQGKIIKSKKLDFELGLRFNVRMLKNNELFLFNPNMVFRINNDLSIKKVKDFKGKIKYLHDYTVRFPYEKERKPNYTVIGERTNPNIIIIDENYNDFTVCCLSDESLDNKPTMYSLVKQKGKSTLIYRQQHFTSYLVSYEKNPYYYFRIPFYIGIYFVITFFLLLLQTIQKKRVEKKYKTQHQLSELQFKTIRNQLEPHFIFNVLNNISSSVNKEEKDKAIRYIAKLSKLIRSSLETSDKMERTLDEELEFTRNYLELEKRRLGDKFKFEINIETDVKTSMLIPKMVIQTYAENSVKHGLRFLDKDGLLEVKISNIKKSIQILIRDNGIGREKAKQLSTDSTGKRLGIMKQFFELYERINKVKIIVEIKDININDSQTGTEVKILIPKTH